MNILFQVSLKQSEEEFQVETLFDCDTEKADVGASEVIFFENEAEATQYLRKQVYEYVNENKEPAPEGYEKAIVGIDDALAEAWILTDDHWNGFVIPFFDKENAMKVASVPEYKLTYNESIDAFVEEFDPEIHQSKSDVDIWRGGFNEDLKEHVYCIGAASWCWGKIELEEI